MRNESTTQTNTRENEAKRINKILNRRYRVETKDIGCTSLPAIIPASILGLDRLPQTDDSDDDEELGDLNPA